MTGRAETQRLERWVHWGLLTGLLFSGLMLMTGLALACLRGAPRPEGPPPALPSLFRAAARGDSLAWLDLGLLALIGTPVLRVAVLALGWWLSGERRFAMVALAVLGLLATGLVLGLG